MEDYENMLPCLIISTRKKFPQASALFFLVIKKVLSSLLGLSVKGSWRFQVKKKSFINWSKVTALLFFSLCMTSIKELWVCCY